jgi:hypothetical protein
MTRGYRTRAQFSACAILWIAILTAPKSVEAQVLYGSMVGHVQDSSEAAVPGASVTILNTDTNQSRQTTTNEAGDYSFPTIPSGTYELKIGKPGFGGFARTGIAVTINSISRVDASLQVGAVSETVTVGAESPALQTDRSEVRSEVTSRALESLPVAPGRNYQQIFRVLPGFTPPQNVHSIPSNPTRALQMYVNGASRSSNNTRVDGASDTNIQLPWITAYVPALEAIETVNVVTNSFDVEQGLAGGASINVQTKSGSNGLHGSAFEYHNDQHIKARPFFIPAGADKPKMVYNQFGATVGGPIRKDKLFYFASYEGTIDRETASRYNTIPTAAIRTGDMNASSNQIYDPETGDNLGANRLPFPNKAIPASRISAISKKIVDLTPLPNVAGSGLTNNYYSTGHFVFDRHNVDSKVNWNPTRKLTAFARFGMLHFHTQNQQAFGDALGGPPISGTGGNPGAGNGYTVNSAFAATYIFNPNFIMDAHFGYTIQHIDSQQPRLNEKIGLDYLGIPGTNGDRLLEGGWPRFQIDNYTTVGINEDYMPYFKSDPQFQYVGNFNWNKGTHNLRFGFDFYHQNLNQSQEQLVSGAFHGGSGGFTFTGGPTALRGGPSPNQFNSYGSFLLGLPYNMGKLHLVPPDYHVRAWLYSMYIGDRWNVNRKLTLSYGLRWEYFPYPTRGDTGLERYDPNTNKMLVCGVGSVPKDCGVQISKRLFTPRVGLAYRITNDFVLRAGYGINNDPFSITEPMRMNFPTQLSLNLQGSNSFAPAGTLEKGIPALVAPDLGAGILDVPATTTLATAPTHIQRGYLQSWNFTLQKNLMYGFTAQAGYVATRQVRQFGFLDLNAGQVIGAGDSGRPLLQRFGRTATTIQYYYPIGTGQYNGLQTTLERRFSRTLALAIHYTWSKAEGVTDGSEQQPSVQAIRYYGLNRSVTTYDRTQNFAVSNVWELPFGKGRKWMNHGGALSAIAGGWQINNVISMMTGTPFTVSSSGASLDMPGSSQRADQVKPLVAKLGNVGTAGAFFDPLAFATVTQPRFGTAGFLSMRGPGLINWDFSLFREVAFLERFKVQFRAEAFNFTNTPHFANPGTNVSNMTLNSDGSVRALNGYAQVMNVISLGREGFDERQFRFGLRFSF